MEDANKMEILFGTNWLSKSIAVDFTSIIFFLHIEVGRFFMTQEIFDGYISNESDYYKALSLIHEKDKQERPYLLCNKDQLENAKCWKNSNPLQKLFKDYTVCTLDDFFGEFPSSLIEKQQRALLLLGKKYPNIGCFIKSEPCFFEYFAKDDGELELILQSLIRKNMIRLEIKRHGDGTFHYIFPFQILEDGWIEIDRLTNKNTEKYQTEEDREIMSVTNIYHLNGDRSKVNINSTDYSENNIYPVDRLFENIKNEIEGNLRDERIKREALILLRELESTQKTQAFGNKYRDFINLFAAHMSIIAPFIPPLTQLFL